MASFTITIDPAVESVGLQTIAVALRLNNVTDAEALAALRANIRTRVAELYVQGDKLKREADAAEAAVDAAATYISAT